MLSMETNASTPHQEEKETNPWASTIINSPQSCNGSNTNIILGSSSSSSSSVTAAAAATPPLTPKTNSSRSETNNPYPTTFVQADTSTFKQVVQMLTGSSDTSTKSVLDPSSSSSNNNKGCIPPIKTSAATKKQGFKLYERRNSLIKSGLMISPLHPAPNGGAIFAHHQNSTLAGFSPRKPPPPPEMLSPSILDFPSLALSPVTPLNSNGDGDPFNNNKFPSPSVGGRGSSSSPFDQEEKAIAEKKFYLHPSPRATTNNPGGLDSEPPQLLPLFPVTSPKISGSSSSS